LERSLRPRVSTKLFQSAAKNVDERAVTMLAATSVAVVAVPVDVANVVDAMDVTTGAKIGTTETGRAETHVVAKANQAVVATVAG
jgi:hypothetical protein